MGDGGGTMGGDDDEYTVRVGRGVEPAGVVALDDLPWEERQDDGLVVPLPHCDLCVTRPGVAHICYREAAPCADCHRGVLRWAEAGYVPWHRICGACGSHWDLHPAEGFYRRARFYESSRSR